MLNVALPKGRLADKVCRALTETGYNVAPVEKDDRRLVFTDGDNGIKYFLVKPSDVAVYVERGAADVGVAGKDILLEYEPDVYELLDLKIGKCRLAVAAKADFFDELDRPLVVATKFVNVTKDYYAKKNRPIEIVKLNGSIELAPLLGMSDVIVDIVETGTTLRENGMKVYEDIVPVSARLIANKSSYKFKKSAVDELVGRLRSGLGIQ
ncbi:MAG: ATP phosphoribosyltransferase [Clostridia bacterium]|nr:ATP phosphoribosyltransferase [Clostridia bacterium]